MALVTTSEVKDYIGITDTTYDTFLGNLIDYASRRFRAYTGRQLEKTTITMKKYLREYTDVVVLEHYPVHSVTSLKLNDDTLTEGTDEDFWVDNDKGIIFFTKDVKGLIDITYEAGYDATTSYPIPKDLKMACILQVAHWFNMRERVDLKSLSSMNETTAYNLDILPQVKDILDTYRRVA